MGKAVDYFSPETLYNSTSQNHESYLIGKKCPDRCNLDLSMSSDRMFITPFDLNLQKMKASLRSRPSLEAPFPHAHAPCGRTRAGGRSRELGGAPR